MIIFNKRDSEGDILETITIGEKFPKYPKNLKELLQYWWNEIPYGYKLEHHPYV